MDPEERFAAELAWADAHVTRTGPVEARERPWASVLRLPTGDGPVWLKVTTPVTRAEVGLYRLLTTTAPDAVLVPLAADEDRGLLLLPDGGPTLEDGPRETLGRDMAEALAAYGRLQRSMAVHRAELVALGLPDAAPTALVDRCDEALAVTGLPDADACRAAVVGWARELADSPGADLVTVDHQDLHPDNVLAGGDAAQRSSTRAGGDAAQRSSTRAGGDAAQRSSTRAGGDAAQRSSTRDGGPRFYDWGDAVVAHPFASLFVALGGLARTLGVDPDDVVVRTARDAYLDVFADLAPHAELVATSVTACRAAIVARALVWHRTMSTVGPDHPFADAARATLASYADPSPFAAA